MALIQQFSNDMQMQMAKLKIIQMILTFLCSSPRMLWLYTICTCQVFFFFFCPLIFRAVWFSHFLCVSLPHSQSPLCQAQMALPACIAPFNFLPLFIPSSCCCLSPSWLLASTQVGSLPRRITVACITLCTSAERGGGTWSLSWSFYSATP